MREAAKARGLKDGIETVVKSEIEANNRAFKHDGLRLVLWKTEKNNHDPLFLVFAPLSLLEPLILYATDPRLPIRLSQHRLHSS